LSKIPSAEERAWLAGLFEGEGCFTGGVKEGNIGRGLVAQVQMTDEDVVKKFHRTIGFGSVNGPITFRKRPSHKPQWRWYVGRFELFQQTVCYLWPWLCERRKARAAELLRQHANYANRPLGPRRAGTKVSPKPDRNEEVRNLFRAGAGQKTLAKQFGVSQARISAIVNFNKKATV